MFLRKKQNRSGSISVQVISKAHGKYKVVKTIGSGRTGQEVQKLWYLGKQEIERLTAQSKIFISEQDTVVEQAMESLSNASIRTVGPELIFGKLYDHIGFGQIKEDLFRHLVVARLAFPLSKLKTTEYLYRYLGVGLKVNTVYRFMDKLNDELKEEAEQIAFAHTKKVLKGNLAIVFYDMTTLYFEASDEDDLRKTGFSKDGKHQNPQIYLGLLVGLGGYAIGYDIFEGDTYEGHTLAPFLESISARFDLGKPVVVADAGLLSKDNLKGLQAGGINTSLGQGSKTNRGRSNSVYWQGRGKTAKQSACHERKVQGSLLPIRGKGLKRTGTTGREGSEGSKSRSKAASSPNPTSTTGGTTSTLSSKAKSMWQLIMKSSIQIQHGTD